MNPQEASTPVPKKKGCRWGCIIPVGCLGLFLLCGGGIGGIFYAATSAIKSSTVYTDAVKTAKADPEVQQLLGTPIEVGMIMTGSINVQNSSGTADIEIPITGPNGAAKIHAVATKANDKWTFTTLQVYNDTKQIDLLAKDKEELK